MLNNNKIQSICNAYEIVEKPIKFENGACEDMRNNDNCFSSSHFPFATFVASDDEKTKKKRWLIFNMYYVGSLFGTLAVHTSSLVLQALAPCSQHYFVFYLHKSCQVNLHIRCAEKREKKKIVGIKITTSAIISATRTKFVPTTIHQISRTHSTV